MGQSAYFTNTTGLSISIFPICAPLVSDKPHLYFMTTSIPSSLTWTPRFKLPVPHVYIVAGAATLGSLFVLRSISRSSKAARLKTTPSPKETILANLTPEEVERLPYPPFALPGARDVDSPYGSTRVYEWGPEDGEPILLIHGISTPSIALTDLADKLVERGCRVMLFGRPPVSLSILASS